MAAAAAARGGRGRSGPRAAGTGRGRKPGGGRSKPGTGRGKPGTGRRGTCRYCGKALPRDRSPGLRLCSDKCRKRTLREAREHPEVRVQFEDATEAERARRKAGPPPRRCNRCNKRIPGEYTRRRYCGDKCAMLAAKSHRRDPAVVEVKNARQREYVRRRYATPEGRAAYLDASKRYRERIKNGGEGPPLRRPAPRPVVLLIE